jgi:hypothetical protein
MNSIERLILAEDIVEAILIKLSTIRLAGDALEAISNVEYDELECDLKDLVAKILRKNEISNERG